MSIMRSYCKNLLFGHSNMPFLRRAINCAVAFFTLRYVRHATFEQLSRADYDVRTYDDGAVPLKPEKATRRLGPVKIQQPVVTPKVAVLRDVLLFDKNLALLPDGRYCYYDTKFSYAKTRNCGNLGRSAVVHVDDATDSMLIRRHHPCTELSGRYFSILSEHSMNFGHFVHDVLSRIYYEDLGVIVPGREKLIVNEMRLPMMKALLSYVFAGYETVEVSRWPIRVEELLLPANMCKPNMFNPAAIAALARRIRRIHAHHSGKEKYKICVSRKEDIKANKATFRDFANMEAYETRMRELGYRVVNTLEMDSKEQFALWANTTDIVGIHGAGMMNMIMMPSGGIYTEIARMGPRKKTYGKSWTARCAVAAGHHVAVIAFPPDAQGHQEIDLDQLESLLSDAY